MKICVTARGNNLEAEVDQRFGRCDYFIVVDPETLEFRAIQNPNAVAAGGAGPNAYQTLSSLGIRICVGASGLVKNAIEAFKQGNLSQAQGSTTPKDSGK